MSEIIGPSTRSKNADYAFPSYDVIAELKALENDSFGESFARKMGELAASWHRRRLLTVFGTARIDTAKLPTICQNEFLELLVRPFQDNFIAKASKQIEESKALLNMPSAKGVLMVASDGNEDLLPHTVWRLLVRILQKKHTDGSPQFSHIHGVIYFTPRMPVQNPKTGESTMLWHAGPRDASDEATITFLRAISAAWPEHVSRVSGRESQHEAGEHIDLENARFAGTTPRMPRINVTDPKR